MADSLLQVKRAPGRLVRSRARKAWPQLILSRRLRGWPGSLSWCGRRRLRRRLLQAQAAGVDLRESGCLVSGAAAPAAQEAAPRRLKSAAPRSVPAVIPAVIPDPAPTAVVPFLTQVPTPVPAGRGRAVLLLPLEQSFFFSGICRVTCLYGRVQVFGFTLRPGQPACEAFSAYTNCLLSITAVPYLAPEKSRKEMKREVRTLLRAHLTLDNRCRLMKCFSPLCSIVLLQRLKPPAMRFIISHPGLSCLFIQETETTQRSTCEYRTLKAVGIRRNKRKNGHQLTESAFSAVSELVSAVCEESDGCPVILVCGSQDIGKSTFNRYLINQLLNSIPCVDYLECDLGQTEFTPPGCISLLNITEPVLGPPFTHQRTPQKMVYYGKTTCKNNFEHYIEIIKYVFSAYKKESPLLINTMGWVTDKGLLLLIDLIRLLSPSHVIQLHSGRSKYNVNLTPDYVDDMEGFYTKRRTKIRNRGFHIPEAENLEFVEDERDSPVVFAGHKLITVRSEFAFRKTPRNRELHNRVFRDLAVLSYLGKLQPSASKSLSPLHSLTPYQVPFNAVALRIMHADVAPTHILYAVNASWVGLCKIQDDIRGYVNGPILLAQTPLCDCVGFGICRGIDMEKRLYHILTPVPPEELRSVNCLLIGAVSVPQCVFKNQGFEGPLPYVTTDYNFKLPGARETIGTRDAEETYKEKRYPRPKLYRKAHRY